jgi:hypothetical protein
MFTVGTVAMECITFVNLGIPVWGEVSMCGGYLPHIPVLNLKRK